MNRVLVLSALLVSGAAFSQTVEPEVISVLKAKYPNTRFSSVSSTPVAGIYEVVMGKNVAYVDASGRYFLFGNLYDMAAQQDLTEPRRAALDTVDVGALPVEDAIKTVRGNGKRTLYVFSDPDCPYCKQLERTLASMSDLTIYTFLFPIAQLHPDAVRKSAAIWCSPDRRHAWEGVMLRNEPVGSSTECPHPVDRNIKLAERLGVRGTPSMFSVDGRRTSGAMSAERVSAFLDAAPVALKGGR